MHRLLISIPFLLGAVLAQGTSPLPAFDFGAWGASAGVYALIVAALVAFLKARIPALTGRVVVLVSLLISEGGAFLLSVSGLLTDPAYTRFAPPWTWLSFGLAGFVLASGGWDALAALISKRQPAIAFIGHEVAAPGSTNPQESK